MVERKKLREICEEVGVSHLQVVEVMRRVGAFVRDSDGEVITKTVGTFYLQKRKARQRTLNGIVYDVPSREVVQLRGPKFPGREVEHIPTRINFLELWGGQPTERFVVEDNGEHVFEVVVDRHPDYTFEFTLTVSEAGELRVEGSPWFYRLQVNAISKHDEDWIAYWSGESGVRMPFESYDSGLVEVGPDDTNGLFFQVSRGLTPTFNINGIGSLNVNGPAPTLLTAGG